MAWREAVEQNNSGSLPAMPEGGGTAGWEHLRGTVATAHGEMGA